MSEHTPQSQGSFESQMIQALKQLLLPIIISQRGDNKYVWRLLEFEDPTGCATRCTFVLK
jgi:hypothetical protein